jgi:hypothetical protein
MRRILVLFGDSHLHHQVWQGGEVLRPTSLADMLTRHFEQCGYEVYCIHSRSLEYVSTDMNTSSFCNVLGASDKPCSISVILSLGHNDAYDVAVKDKDRSQYGSTEFRALSGLTSAAADVISCMKPDALYLMPYIDYPRLYVGMHYDVYKLIVMEGLRMQLQDRLDGIPIKMLKLSRPDAESYVDRFHVGYSAAQMLFKEIVYQFHGMASAL